MAQLIFSALPLRYQLFAVIFQDQSQYLYFIDIFFRNISGQISSSSIANSSLQDVKLGLQVDYWKDKETSKFTLKTNFKSFHVACLSHSERFSSPQLILDVVTKGKKNLSEFIYTPRTQIWCLTLTTLLYIQGLIIHA